MAQECYFALDPLKIVTCTCILNELKTNVLWPSLFQAIKQGF